MRRLHSRLPGFAAALSLAACRAERPPSAVPERCEANAAATMPTFDATRPEALAGGYELVTVGDNETARNHRKTGRLTLWVQDSVRRRRGLLGPLSPGHERTLGAAIEYEPRETTTAWQKLASRDPDRPGGMYTSGHLRFGGYDMIDGAGTTLTIVHADSSGFRGTWVSDLGIVAIMDSSGRVLPNPAGYFCARRLPNAEP
jgi:hypothetical protein